MPKVDFNNAIEELKEYLPQYLESQSVRITQKHMFCCINPDHKDSNPSSGFVPGTDNKVFHCFACNVSGNIFLAAHFLEGKPLSGRGFISDNVLPLARQFGIMIPESDLTEEQLQEMEIQRAYSNAHNIIKNSPLTTIVQEKLLDLNWPGSVRSTFGVGGIISRADYEAKMIRQYGHDRDFLFKIDLLSSLFNPDHLIYTIKDSHGTPIAFSARNLKFEEQIAKHVDGEGEKPSKYINTSGKNPLYKKSEHLFNFNIAKKFAPPLYIVEGNADPITAYYADIKNMCAIGSTAFTLDHLNLIIQTGIKHLIFVLDPDKAGSDGTDRFVKMIEEHVGGRVGLRVEIIVMPEGTNDPDAYIRSFGFATGGSEFKKLEKIDVFSWTLAKGMKSGKDPLTLASDSIPLIVNEQSYIVRMRMTEQLAAQTGLNKDALWREVLRLLDNDLIKLEEEKVGVAKRISSALMKNPKDVASIIAEGQHEIEQVDKRKLGYDPLSVFKAVQFVVEAAARSDGNPTLKSGYQFLDEALDGGFPMQIFVPIPGKPNQGKTTFLDNLAINLLENNDDCIVFYHTIDDALNIRIPRLQSAKFKIPSKYFLHAYKYLQNPPDKYPNFPAVYAEAQRWIYSLIEQEKLILVDVTMLPGQLPAMEAWVKSLKEKFPNKQLVVMGDNFHLYDLPGEKAGEELHRSMSKFIKRMMNENRTVGFFTMELPKDGLRPGIRPRMSKIKGSSGMAFDANVNFGIYNDMKDMGDRAELYWSDPTDIEIIIGPAGERITSAKKKPIIELVIDKSKLSSFSGSIFFRLDPETGHIDECNETEQQVMRDKSNASQGSKNDQNQGQPVNIK